MTPTRPSPRCSHHVKMRRPKCGSGGKDAERRCVSPAQPPCEPALPMRRSPHGATAIRRAVAAAARRARHRSIPEMRRSAPRIRAYLLSQLPPRLPVCLLMQGAIFLPELPPKAGARLWGLGRVKRPCASPSPAIRLQGIRQSIRPPSLRGLPAHRNCVLKPAPTGAQMHVMSISARSAPPEGGDRSEFSGKNADRRSHPHHPLIGP